jgi:23S rRNA maturation mini-RNase III
MEANDNAAGLAALDEMIAACRSIPGMARREAPRVAELLQETIAQAVAESRTPEGEPWRPTKKGTAPLRGAMSAVTVAPDGDGVTATLTGHHVFHQRGTKSAAANRQAKRAGAARREAKAAAKVARQLTRREQRANAKAASAPTKRRKETWAKKAAEAAAPAKAARSLARGKEMVASAASSAAKAQGAVGGLPARHIIPESMPMTLTEATREFFKEKWEKAMGVGE